jgi:hypothetical protein
MNTVRAADAQYDYAGSDLQASTNKTVKNEKCSEAILAHFFYLGRFQLCLDTPALTGSGGQFQLRNLGEGL